MTSVERFVTVKLRERNSAGATSGWGACSIHQGNKAVAMAPMPSATKAEGLDQPRCWPEIAPTDSPANAKAVSTVPGKSRLPLGAATRPSPTYRRVSHKATRTSGTLIRKTARQDRASTSRPPTMGPRTATPAEAPDNTRIARRCPSPETEPATRASDPGTMRGPEIPANTGSRIGHPRPENRRPQRSTPVGHDRRARSPRLSQRIVKRRLFGQYLVHRRDRDRALAHGRGDPLGAAAANIADREHAGDAGFQKVGLSAQGPLGGSQLVHGQGRARLDE